MIKRFFKSIFINNDYQNKIVKTVNELPIEVKIRLFKKEYPYNRFKMACYKRYLKAGDDDEKKKSYNMFCSNHENRKAMRQAYEKVVAQAVKDGIL